VQVRNTTCWDPHYAFILGATVYMVANTCCLLGHNHPTYRPTTTVHTYVQQSCLFTHKHPDYSPITILLTYPQPPSILMQSNTAYLPTPFLFLNSPIPSLLTVHTHNYHAYLLTPSPFIHTILTLYHAAQLPHLSSVLTHIYPAKVHALLVSIFSHSSCEANLLCYYTAYLPTPIQCM
jgi:hypothetical protein